MEIKCKLKFDQDNSKVFIEGLTGANLEIDYSGDIDLTNLIALLTKKIEGDDYISLEKDKEETLIGKEEILFNTLSKIVLSFNNAVIINP